MDQFACDLVVNTFEENPTKETIVREHLFLDLWKLKKSDISSE